MTRVTLRILGRLEALVDGREVDLSSARERALLGVLVLHVGEVVSVDTLVDSVWGERAPVSARHLVHEYVSRLRGALGDASVIVTRAPGYIVERDACDVDAARFTECLHTARAAVAAGEVDGALQAFDEALALWRGDVLSGVAVEGDGRLAAARLDDERRTARSERVDLALIVGRHHELIPELRRAVADEPHDEYVLGQLMVALYRDGRQADALARYRIGRQTLVEQFGIEPGAELRALEQAILRHDPALASPPASETFSESGGAPVDSPPRAPRRRAGVRLPSSSSPGRRRSPLLQSSQELLVWLAARKRGGSGAAAGEHLLNLAISEGKVARLGNPLGEWLYELRASGLVNFDDSDAASMLRSGQRVSANDVFLLRYIGITAAGRAFLKSARPT